MIAFAIVAYLLVALMVTKTSLEICCEEFGDLESSYRDLLAIFLALIWLPILILSSVVALVEQRGTR